MSEFTLVRDDHGYAAAIAVYGYFIIHLDRGTVRNEENASKLVAILNAAAASVSNPAWACMCDADVDLENALQDIIPNNGVKGADEGGVL